MPFHQSIVGLPLDKVDVIIEPLFGNANIPNVVWFHLHFPQIAKRLKADMVWTPRPETPILSVGKAKRMRTVHDVVGKEFRNTMTWKSKLLSIPLSERSIKCADYIWCNSHYTEGKLNQYFPNRKQKNVVIGDSCSTLFKRLSIDGSVKTALFQEYGITKGFILFVGTLEPRKNLSFLLKIIPEIYKKSGYKLLVVGASGWKNSDVAQIINDPSFLKQAVVFAKYIEMEKLILLYNLATLYVSTALNEGFGMPQLEAMACGCPVVSPHNSAMIEIVNGRGIAVEGWEVSDWCSAISKAIGCDRNKLMYDLKDYDWNEIAERVRSYIIDNM